MRTLTLLAVSLALAGCGVGEGSPCSPVSNVRRCLDGTRAYDCQGPMDAKGMGKIRIVEDCAQSGQVCAEFTSRDGACIDKAEYCAFNITPQPEVCR